MEGWRDRSFQVTHRVVVREAVHALALGLLTADLPANYVANVAFPREGQPSRRGLNARRARLLVAALGATLARRAGYAAST